MYSFREALAYSAAGKALCTLIRNAYYPKARVHWVQQALADLSFSKL